jgi:hypothetical protein
LPAEPSIIYKDLPLTNNASAKPLPWFLRPWFESRDVTAGNVDRSTAVFVVQGSIL